MAKAISTFPTSVSMTNVCVLSIGGPPAPQLTLPRSADYGLWQWIPWLMSLLFDSSVEASHRNTQLLLGHSYFRCSPEMASHIPLHLQARLVVNEWAHWAHWAHWASASPEDVDFFLLLLISIILRASAPLLSHSSHNHKPRSPINVQPGSDERGGRWRGARPHSQHGAP